MKVIESFHTTAVKVKIIKGSPSCSYRSRFPGSHHKAPKFGLGFCQGRTALHTNLAPDVFKFSALGGFFASMGPDNTCQYNDSSPLALLMSNVIAVKYQRSRFPGSYGSSTNLTTPAQRWDVDLNFIAFWTNKSRAARKCSEAVGFIHKESTRNV